MWGTAAWTEVMVTGTSIPALIAAFFLVQIYHNDVALTRDHPVFNNPEARAYVSSRVRWERVKRACLLIISIIGVNALFTPSLQGYDHVPSPASILFGFGCTIMNVLFITDTLLTIRERRRAVIDYYLRTGQPLGSLVNKTRKGGK